MRDTIYKKQMILGLLSLAIASEAGAINDRAAAMANQNGNICYRQALAPMPDVIAKDNVKIVGVSMGENGELLRYKLKPGIKAALPSFISIADRDFFNQLTPDDFEEDVDLPSDAETPLDVSSAGETVIYFTLLPDTWQFESVPLSLKVPVEHGKAPFITLPSEPITDKTALLYKAAQSDTLYRYCLYAFNLHVTIAQGASGKRLYTPIIIDPVIIHNEHPDAITEDDEESESDTSETAEGGN